jgi:lipid-A-disaccharide synthase-like uncharacterized protein
MQWPQIIRSYGPCRYLTALLPGATCAKTTSDIMTITSEKLWIAFGLAGQIIFGMRFVIQWIASERRKESYIPMFFWYLSLAGASILLTYAIHRRDPVFILGQTTGFIVYVRNIMLIYKKRWAKQDPDANRQDAKTPRRQGS